jgi:hypothetical protein
VSLPPEVRFSAEKEKRAAMDRKHDRRHRSLSDWEETRP